ncbi:MAG TPA: TonB family protein [Candidatus Eremiobacteraceae bacterium]|nr:TonB family protein [Candidatus Eremiobacteraceae bacterium]
MFTRTLHTAAVLGVITATIIGLAAASPASAAPRVTFSALVPVAPINVMQTAAAGNTCPDPDSSAHVTDIYPTQWFKLISAQTNHASVQLQVDLDSVGNVLQARVTSSSGNTLLDQQALLEARNSKYAPEVHNCNSFKQSYYVEITFDNPMAVIPENGASARHLAQ